MGHFWDILTCPPKHFQRRRTYKKTRKQLTINENKQENAYRKIPGTMVHFIKVLFVIAYRGMVPEWDIFGTFLLVRRSIFSVGGPTGKHANN
jgi:hypothetical protein